jgi:C-terminal processing protease CtpA/Prc
MESQTFSHELGLEAVTFYGASITVGDVRMSDGGSLEHGGVTPDEIVLPTGADLANKRDPVLARAVATLGGSLTPEQAGTLFR